MGALARALLLPLVAQWLLRPAPALAPAPFTLPLRVASATSPGAAPTPGPGPPAQPRADGLAFALEPAGGAANFLAVVDNLQGDSGRGYYLEVLIGTPPQKVSRQSLARPPARTGALQLLRSLGCSRELLGGSWERPAEPPRRLAWPQSRLGEGWRGAGGAAGGTGAGALRPRSGGGPVGGAAQGCVHVFQNLFTPHSLWPGTERRPVTSISGDFLRASYISLQGGDGAVGLGHDAVVSGQSLCITTYTPLPILPPAVPPPSLPSVLPPQLAACLLRRLWPASCGAVPLEREPRVRGAGGGLLRSASRLPSVRLSSPGGGWSRGRRLAPRAAQPLCAEGSVCTRV